MNRRINIRSILPASITLVFLFPSLTSCSSLIAGRGTNVHKFQVRPQDSSRDDVWADLGTPTQSEKLSPMVTTRRIAENRHPSAELMDIQDSGEVIAIIDQHRLNGPVFDRTANFAAHASFSYAVMTLGLSELYFIPGFLSSDSPDKVFYTFFDRQGNLVTTALQPIKTVDRGDGS